MQEDGDDGGSDSEASSNNYDVDESDLIDDSELQVIHKLQHPTWRRTRAQREVGGREGRAGESERARESS